MIEVDQLIRTREPQSIRFVPVEEPAIPASPQANLRVGMLPGTVRLTRSDQGNYVSVVEMVNSTNPTETITTKAINILPQHLRPYYEYVTGNEQILNTQGWSCLHMAVFFNCEELMGQKFSVENVLLNNYRKIEADSSFSFGDLVYMTIQSTKTRLPPEYHAFTYVSDDLVFSKNGTGPQTPYLLRRKKDVLKEYGFGKITQEQVYRHIEK